ATRAGASRAATGGGATARRVRLTAGAAVVGPGAEGLGDAGAEDLQLLAAQTLLQLGARRSERSGRALVEQVGKADPGRETRNAGQVEQVERETHRQVREVTHVQ